MAIMNSLISNDGVPVVRRPNYVSTSMQASLDTADFNSSAHHETQYVISVPAGVRALSVANHSEFSENELIIDVVSARKPGISMPRVKGLVDLHYRNGYAIIVFISTKVMASGRSVNQQ